LRAALEDDVDVAVAQKSAADVTVTRPRLRWWLEVLFVLAFYGIYSGIRNVFGSAAVSPDRAMRNADHVIHIERALGLFQEERIQRLFLRWDLFIRFWNIFYGTFHFIVTIAALLWLFRRFPLRYSKWRNVLAATTALALLGFSMFPLMPPRLLSDCTTPYGACAGFNFVDTLARVGGLWSFDSGTMQSISNQYAAMPSLHFAWSTWCLLAVFPTVRSRSVRAVLLVYPMLTLFAIVVTANHYWLDAVGGASVLLVGYIIGSILTRLGEHWRRARARHRREHAGEYPDRDGYEVNPTTSVAT
jgi:hypothetical protein